MFSYPIYSTSSEDIDFSQAGWFDHYAAFRRKKPPQVSFPAQVIWTDQAMEATWKTKEEQYQLILISGLIYGFPFLYPLQPLAGDSLSPRLANQVLLLDFLWYSVLAHPGHGPAAQAEQLIRDFYHGLTAEERPEQGLETMLKERVPMAIHWLDWRKKGVNAHLFWDWYLFQDFLDQQANGAVKIDFFTDLKRRQKDLEATTLRLIAAAIHSDVKVRHREKIIEHFFLESSHVFGTEEIHSFNKDFHDGVSLKDVLVTEKNALSTHYWMDVLLLVLSADQDYNTHEYAFTAELLAHLALTKEDLINSQLILGGFIYRFGRKIPFLNSRKISMVLISRAVGENFRTMKDATQAEYHETVHMATTFGKLLQHQLGISKKGKMPTEEEIKAAFAQLKDVPKFLPFFTVFFVPVPGLTESYILLAYTIERLSGNSVKLLPSNFSKMIKSRNKK